MSDPAEDNEKPATPRSRGRVLVFPVSRLVRRPRWWERALHWLRYHDRATGAR